MFIQCLQISKLNLQHSWIAMIASVNSHSYLLLQLELFFSCFEVRLNKSVLSQRWLIWPGFGCDNK